MNRRRTPKYDTDYFSLFSIEKKYVCSNIIFPMLEEYIQIDSVVDIGCGVGAWLKYFHEKCIDIVGIDNDWVPVEYLVIPNESFITQDLNEEITFPRRFSLAICIEVAEHLKPDRAKSFVSDIVRLSDHILFSAAIPGQGGVGHINEQYPEYWAEFFADEDYAPYDFLRPRIWNSDAIEHPWLKQNVLLYVKNGCTSRIPFEYKAGLSNLTIIEKYYYEKVIRDYWYRFGRTVLGNMIKAITRGVGKVFLKHLH